MLDAPAARGLRVRLPEPFRIPGYSRLWLAAVAMAFSAWLERLAIGWLVLENTGSPFLAAMTFAVRIAPNLIVGPLGGTIADRVSRPALVAATAAARGATLTLLALLVFGGADHVTLVLAAAAITGGLTMFSLPAHQALIVDIAGIERSQSAIGWHGVGARTMALLGSLVGGVVIDHFGVGPALLVGAGALVPAGVLLLGLRTTQRRVVAAGRSLLGEALEGVRLLLRTRVVALLLGFALAVEIMGFAHSSLLPALARQGLEVGAAGLGLLTFSVGVGGITGSWLLSALSRVRRRGRLMLSVTFCFGALLVAVAATNHLVFAMVALAGVGACAAMFDQLQALLLQANVPDEMRGRVMGGWVWAIGWGWLGPVILGGVAEAAGVRSAFAAGGLAVVLIALVGVFAVPAVRRA